VLNFVSGVIFIIFHGEDGVKLYTRNGHVPRGSRLHVVYVCVRARVRVYNILLIRLATFYNISFFAGFYNTPSVP
jgi:hypothetical protein